MVRINDKQGGIYIPFPVIQDNQRVVYVFLYHWFTGFAYIFYLTYCIQTTVNAIRKRV
jgi:hypothetical protein